MKKWNVTPATENNSMTSQVNYDKDGLDWKIYQNEKPFLEEAKRDRENAKYQKRDVGYKKFATIPDIVSIEILDKHGIDIHDQSFMYDIDKKKKFMKIIKTEYPHLLSY